MHRISLGAFSIAFVAAACLSPTSVQSQNVESGVVVGTLAGSGAAGFADGPAAQASFLMPTALAYDASGNLYVADTAAQRIRRVARVTARVVTVAGSGETRESGLWVDGGYADGPALRAKFHAPSGIVIAHSGTIYVSDTYNHCIRAISHGMVTTYAGSLRAGNADGPRRAATFSRPLGLAVDSRDNLYVADADVGLREIDARTGAVTTFKMLLFTPFNVLIARQPDTDSDVMVIADVLGIHIASGTSVVDFNVLDQIANYKIYQIPARHKVTQGLRPLGNPYGLALAGDGAIVYSDLRFNTIRALDFKSNRLAILAGQATEEGANNGLTRDGSGAAARFNGPMGMAAGPNGVLAVADAGSRQIRVLTRRAFRSPFSPSPKALFPPPAPRGAYTIAYLGNSFAWWDTDWEDSIQGQLQARLEADRFFQRGRRKAQVIPMYFVGANIRALREYLRSLLLVRPIDAVVVQLNTFAIPHRRDVNIGPASSIELAADAQRWLPALKDTLAGIHRDCLQARIACLVVSHPFAWELASNENVMYGVLQGNLVPQGAIEKPVREAVRASGLRFVDMWSIFRTEMNVPGHQPLFGTYDPHFSVHGRATVAQAVARELLRWAPWLRNP
ncbi:MAG: hypothetical protein DLM50_02055 [Candidatus Meridianibacter frigidus]|nr:MAG: hypothetical protein DLM50_02055 [Candidatus Eremiobacteraeota bacterium]